MSEKVLSLPRMARRLQVTQTWLRSEAKEGRVPCLRAGQRFLFVPEAVEDAIAERAAKGEK